MKVNSLYKSFRIGDLAAAVSHVYGEVWFAVIHTDKEYYYPRSTGRITFGYDTSYKNAIINRFINIRHLRTVKEVSIFHF